MRMKKKLLAIVMAFVFLFGVSDVASAYVLSGHRFAGGIGGTGYYTVPSNATFTFNGVTEWYGLIINDTVTRWNNRVEYISSSQPENVNFVQTTNMNVSIIDYYVNTYGNTGWRGVTEFFAWGGTQLSPTGSFPNQNWDWCRIRLNVNEIHFNTYNQKFGTTAHEFGHTLGLAHSNTTFSVMWANYLERQVTPTTDDEAGVRAIY